MTFAWGFYYCIYQDNTSGTKPNCEALKLDVLMLEKVSLKFESTKHFLLLYYSGVIGTPGLAKESPSLHVNNNPLVQLFL